MKSQPKELYLLNFVSMWECFSYYGMRVLLVLFMIHEFELTDGQAFGFYALYTTLVEFGGIFGGMIADKYLGLKRTIIFGGWTIVFGHMSLIVPESELFFFMGLGLIIVGTSLFRSNIVALIGQCYEDGPEDDKRRDAGFTLYYTGINLGGFLATLLCGFVAEIYGFHAGFGLAAFGMILGMLVFGLFCGTKTKETKKELLVGCPNLLLILGITLTTPLCALAICNQEYVMPFFPVVALAGIYYVFKQTKECTPSEKKGLNTILISIVFLIIFYACEEQIGSSLILFATRHVDLETVFGQFPASSLVTFNPLTILIVGPLLARLLRQVTLGFNQKIAMSFAFLCSAFLLLYSGCLACGEMLYIGYLIGCICLISIGELFIGPTIYAVAAKNSPKALQGLVMGMITLGFSLSNLLSGFLSQTMAVTDELSTLQIYMSGFLIMICLAAVLAVAPILLNKQLSAENK